MKAFLHFLSGAILYALLLLGGAWLVHAAWQDDVWMRSLNWVAKHRLWTLSGLAAGWWLVVLFALTGHRRGRGETVVSLNTETGSISVSTRALEDYLARLSGEFAAVLELKPNVSAEGADITVMLDTRIRSNTQIPELCRMLQERVRHCIRDEMGLTDPRDVRVNVKEIVVSAAETQAGIGGTEGEWAGGAKM